jgi:hypothetical protein
MISVKKTPMGTFVGILEDLLAEQAADPAFSPAGRSSRPSPGCPRTWKPGP